MIPVSQIAAMKMIPAKTIQMIVINLMSNRPKQSIEIKIKVVYNSSYQMTQFQILKAVLIVQNKINVVNFCNQQWRYYLIKQRTNNKTSLIKNWIIFSADLNEKESLLELKFCLGIFYFENFN